jgi:hypothetical protein
VHGLTPLVVGRRVDDAALDAGLKRAMSRPANTDALFDYAVDRLVESVLRGTV